MVFSYTELQSFEKVTRRSLCSNVVETEVSCVVPAERQFLVVFFVGLVPYTVPPIFAAYGVCPVAQQGPASRTDGCSNDNVTVQQVSVA